MDESRIEKREKCRFVGSCRNFFEGPKVLESSVVLRQGRRFALGTLGHIFTTLNVIPTLGLQASTNRWAPGLVNCVLALAYHFCLNLPVAFMQPGPGPAY